MIRSRGSTYPLQRTGRADPALCPGRVLLTRLPLGPSPSLHRLRNRPFGFVRRLPRYYGTVRLPTPVRHRRSSLDFPMRSAAPSAADRRGTSRVPREVLACMLGVSDRAGSSCASRYRRLGCCLPPAWTTSAPRSDRRCRDGALISRLNGQPARPPVNASPLPLRTTTHDSGPVWIAIPSPCGTSIHNTSPVYPGTPKRNAADAALSLPPLPQRAQPQA